MKENSGIDRGGNVIATGDDSRGMSLSSRVQYNLDSDHFDWDDDID